MNIIAIIPARGGSKGIPKKNIRSLGGLPLIAWSILKARMCNEINTVYVSTDNEEIANIAIAFGASVPFMRPLSLGADSTPTIEVVNDFLINLVKTNTRPDFVVLLQPTQPFRRVRTILSSINLAIRTNSGVVTISPVNDHPILMRKFNPYNSSVSNLLQGVNSTIRRQDFPNIYKVNGAVYVNPTEDYFYNTSLNDNPYAILTDKRESVDIDEPEDLEYAQWLIDRGDVAIPQTNKLK